MKKKRLVLIVFSIFCLFIHNVNVNAASGLLFQVLASGGMVVFGGMDQMSDNMLGIGAMDYYENRSTLNNTVSNFAFSIQPIGTNVVGGEIYQTVFKWYFLNTDAAMGFAQQLNAHTWLLRGGTVHGINVRINGNYVYAAVTFTADNSMTSLYFDVPGNGGISTQWYVNYVTNTYFPVTSTVQATQQSVDILRADVNALQAAYNEASSKLDETNRNLGELNQKQEETNNKLGDLNDNLTDSSVDNSSANGFFNDFQSDDFGLSDIVTMPLKFIKGLSNSQCYDLQLPLPFVEQNAKLPCMTSVYQEHFSSFLTLYQTITTGFIAYWVCVNIFRLVQNFKNPDNDEVEVLDL